MPDSLYEWSSAASTDIGMGRGKNEDAFLDEPARGLWVVADGMGGHTRGDYASERVVKNLLAIDTSGNDPKTLIEDIHKSLLRTNLELLEYARRVEVPMVGSTAVVLLLKENWGACVWMGDSRLYMVRDQKLHQITRDHSLVQDWLSQGLITTAEADRHQAKNVITSCLGAKKDPKIDFRLFPIQAGDTLLLCTDGLYGSLPEPQLAKVLASEDPKIAITKLIVSALNNGSNDNLTGVIVRVQRNRGNRHQKPLIPGLRIKKLAE